MPNLLFIGDIVGRPGRTFVRERLPSIRKELAIDIVVANAENAAGGAGTTAKICRDLAVSGVDAITLGDHIWDQRGFEKDIDSLEFLCRPANVPEACPGRGWLIVERDGFRLGVFTVIGRQFMKAKVSCPFLAADALLNELKGQVDACFVEIHAEATSEKIAFGWYLDGRVAAIAGTHTHIPTADASILPRGTGYITDAGMSGPYKSVLGREIRPVLGHFLDGMPRRFEVAQDDVRLCGALYRINHETGLCDGIEPVCIRDDDSEQGIGGNLQD